MELRTIGAFLLGAVTAERLLRLRPVRFARMSGTSIAHPSAFGWVTDFLNAAYYARPPDDRDIADLRLAFTILTTRWHHLGRRLQAVDVAAFHHAFGRLRFDPSHGARGTLDRPALLDGAARLHGDWFAAAAADPDRRGWGIAFPTTEAKAAYQPEVRLAHARLGALTPPTAPGDDQVWHTYPPVEAGPPEAVVAALTAVEQWPEYGSSLGRFTPLRRGDLTGQTFEIEVLGGTTTRTPVLLRGYVTVTDVATGAEDLRTYVDALNEGMARFGRDEPTPVPAGATPHAALDLTTHEGHFMGSARNRLLCYGHDGRTLLRVVGTWDPLDWHLAQVYDRAGRAEQHAFWGRGTSDESMLHQLARATGARAVER
jgi:hypothetical protein